MAYTVHKITFWAFFGPTCMYKKLRNFGTVPPSVTNLVSKCAGNSKENYHKVSWRELCALQSYRAKCRGGGPWCPPSLIRVKEISPYLRRDFWYKRCKFWKWHCLRKMALESKCQNDLGVILLEKEFYTHNFFILSLVFLKLLIVSVAFSLGHPVLHHAPQMFWNN